MSLKTMLEIVILSAPVSMVTTAWATTKIVPLVITHVQSAQTQKSTNVSSVMQMPKELYNHPKSAPATKGTMTPTTP